MTTEYVKLVLQSSLNDHYAAIHHTKDTITQYEDELSKQREKLTKLEREYVELQKAIEE